ncbi:hypothetical protein N6H14_26430 [Paenibacillus sp. CC-CFT747]|nr:hypothetical protein N6H14_26430 [Paenibacillus sp. CC-CFT747]
MLDYLMKVPLTSSDIKAALEKAAGEIGIMEAKEEELSKLNRARLENVHRMRKQIFQEFLRGEVEPGQMERMSDDLRLDGKLGPYSCLVMEIGKYEEFERIYKAREQSVLKYAMLNVLEETLRQVGNGFACETSEFTMMGVISWPTYHSQSEQEARAQALGNTIIYNMKTYLKRNVNLAFSPVYNGWPTLPDAYRQCRQRLRAVYYLKDGTVLGPFQPIRPDEEKVSALQEQLRRLVRLLTSQQTEEVEEAFEQMAETAREWNIPRERMELYLRGFLAEVESHYASSGGALPSNPAERMSGLKFEDQLELCRSYLSGCRQMKLSSLRPEITKAKQYVEDHLTRKLSLEEVADHVNLTPPTSAVCSREKSEKIWWITLTVAGSSWR